MLHKKLVFLPQPSIIDTRQTRNNLTTKFKTLATSSLVKLHYFQFAFLENWVYKKTKEINKRSREFLFKHFKKHFFLSTIQWAMSKACMLKTIHLPLRKSKLFLDQSMVCILNEPLNFPSFFSKFQEWLL